MNNNNYEQPIALFVIIPAKNTFTNHYEVDATVTTSIGDDRDLY